MLHMLDTFSGVGMISLAAEWTGRIKTVGFCEIDPYCRKVLQQHWPGVPIFGDIRKLTRKELICAGIDRVDIMAGGFPCQPKRNRLLYRLTAPVPGSTEKERLSWPRPTTGAPLCGGTHNFNQMIKLMQGGVITDEERRNLTQGNGGRSNPALMEWLMGFPIGWTEITPSETP